MRNADLEKEINVICDLMARYDHLDCTNDLRNKIEVILEDIIENMPGDNVFPDNIAWDHKIEISCVYKVFNALVAMGVLARIKRVSCPYCGRANAQSLEVYGRDDYICPACGHSFSTNNDPNYRYIVVGQPPYWKNYK